MMIQYIKIAFRNIKRHSAYSALNISGLAIGMTCSILIFLWVYDEWSYDRCYENAEELFRVVEDQHLQEGKGSLIVPTASALVTALKSEYPEIIRTTRICPTPLTLKKGDEFIEEMVTSADKDFLKMFGVKFILGDLNTAFDNPHNLLMTEDAAIKFFGTTAVLGRTIESRGFSVTVTGVVRSFSRNSHLQFNYLMPIEWMADFGGPVNDWNHRDKIYLELKKGTNVEVLNEKIRDFIQRHKKDTKSEIFLQNIRKVHLYSSGKYIADDAATGNITYVRLMSLMAAFILAIAFINFVNLSTAIASKRAREVGVRKVTGANRPVLVAQFLGESLVIMLIATIIAMIFIDSLLPDFNNLTGKQITINYHNPWFYFAVLTFIMFCTLIAGSYPAFYLSSLKPLTVINGIVKSKPGKRGFRRVLVVFQLFISILLIAFTLIVKKQVNFLRSKDMGFNRNNIVYFMFPTRPSDSKLESLKKELLENPDILSVTRGWNPFYNDGIRNGYSWAGKKPDEDISFHIMSVDQDYVKTYELKMKSGRFFSSEFLSDKTSIVLNEEGARVLGFSDPVGETMKSPNGTDLRITGVVKDFHIQSLHHKIEPLIMQIGETNNFYVRVKPDRILTTVEYIKGVFNSFDPGLPIDLHFLDDDFENLYIAEQRVAKMSEYLSFLAIIISCLGLLGLSSFMIENRTKEVGIRKVNGAKPSEIFSLFSREYIVLVSISFALATPIAWFASFKWLQNFAYKTELSWWIYALSGIIAFGLTTLAVSSQSWRAATRNPVEALRYE
jgi:putative ABC transport system permease protein